MTINKLAEAMPKSGYPIHPIAAAMPEMSASEFTELKKDIKEHGQRVPIVLLDDQVLDGRHRQEALIANKQEPIFYVYDPVIDGESPVNYVAALNLKRRNLTPSQAAMAAARLIPFIEAEEIKARGATAPDTGKSDSTVDSSGEFAQAPPSKSKGGKTAKKAAAIMGVGARSVETAKKVLKEDPKAAAAVTKGEKSLHEAATGKPSKGSVAAAAYDKALERIGKVCGEKQAKGIKEQAILRNRKEAIAYAALPDAKMLAIRTFIDQGWTVKKATLYKAEDIEPTHTVRALIERTVAAGGKYSQKVHIENMGLVAKIAVEVVKGEATKARAAKKKAPPKKKAAKKKPAATKKKK